MFITTPKKAAIPTSTPSSRPTPTASSPSAMSQPNQPWAWLSIRTCRNERYQSKVIGGEPCPAAGTFTAFCQYPRSAPPPSIQPVPVSLCQPATANSKPRKIRIGSQNRPAVVLLKRYRAKAGPSTLTTSAPGDLRSSNIRTRTTTVSTQNATVATRFSVVPALGKTHGFSM